jgi:hypothetical protein
MKQARNIIWTALFMSASLIHAQGTMKAPPSGGNKKASVSERIGITDITIHYDRPAVKGREGHIYGTPVVHKGYIDLSVLYGTSKTAPWRAGANENTTIEFSTDVKIEGKDLQAGTYGFFIAYDSAVCTLIFSHDCHSWGSFFYSDKEDALRVNVKPQKLDKSVEWLKYEFIDEKDNSATVAMEWEKLRIPFRIEVDLVKTELSDFRQELKGDKGFVWESYYQAASFCLQHNTNFQEAYGWAETAVQNQRNFSTLSMEAALAEKSGKKAKSDSCMKEALAMGTMLEIHQYGKTLIALGQKKEALDVFKMNAKRYPNQFVTYAGLARGYSANGDFKTALLNAKLALPKSPNQVNADSVNEMIRKLDHNQDIN